MPIIKTYTTYLKQSYEQNDLKLQQHVEAKVDV